MPAARFTKILARDAQSGVVVCFALLAILFLPVALAAQNDLPRGAQNDWPYAGHDPGARRYSPLTQINKQTVTKLRRAWTFHTGNPADDVDSEGAPLVIDGVMYLDAGKNVFALDPVTGRQIWKFEVKGTNRRGLSYWPGDKQTPPRIILGVADDKMLALDAKTGKPASGFGEDGFVSGVSPAAAPVIYHDLIIAGQNRVQSVRAFDAHTGKLVWTFYTKAQPGQPGYDTWKDNAWDVRSGNDVWSFMTLDPERGIVYIPIPPTGGPDFYGGGRLAIRFIPIASSRSTPIPAN